MRVHYLEIVTPDVSAVCSAYEGAAGAEFGEPEPRLGNAKVAPTAEGGMVGVRAPMHEAEKSTVRPYWLTEDIEAAVAEAEASGAEIIHPPLAIEGFGSFAIFTLGGVEHALWQL